MQCQWQVGSPGTIVTPDGEPAVNHGHIRGGGSNSELERNCGGYLLTRFDIFQCNHSQRDLNIF